MKKKDRRRPGFVLSANFLMTIVVMIAAAYITLVVTTFKGDLAELKNDIKEGNDKFVEFAMEIKPRIAIIEEKITSQGNRLLNHIKGGKKN